MLRTTLNCILVTLLLIGTTSAPAADLTVAEQVAKLKVGRTIKVKLNSGETLKGRMGSTATGQFALEPRNTKQGTARIISFQEARSVKPDGLSAGQKWAIFGVIWVAVGVVAKLTV